MHLATSARDAAESMLVNDVHSRLNPTRVLAVVRPRTQEELCAAVRRAADGGQALSIAGGRHAMGGQQLGTGTVLIDTTALTRVIGLDPARGLVEVEAGLQWPELIAHLGRVQADAASPWTIAQKQTGADRFTIGGSVAANIHGRGLRRPPLVADVESLVLIGADGEPRRCDRRENAHLFRLVVGGYGLFGIVASVTLRLVRRRRLERLVEVIDVGDLMAAFERRMDEGCLFGDVQFAIDPEAPAFLRSGVFSCYRQVEDAGGPEACRELSAHDWRRLIHLAHTDKSRAFREYAAYYRSTSGQRYWSDTHQLSVYLDDYHQVLDRQLGAAVPGSEVITEICVPRAALGRFLDDVRADLRRHGVDVVYGTIRLIEPDEETFLAWARERFACVVLNLHVTHDAAGLTRAAAAFRRLIDRGLAHGGTYYLTYHRSATRAQVEAAYPQFVEFLRRKRHHDPTELFRSDWYDHYRAMFADVI